MNNLNFVFPVPAEALTHTDSLGFEEILCTALGSSGKASEEASEFTSILLRSAADFIT